MQRKASFGALFAFKGCHEFTNKINKIRGFVAKEILQKIIPIFETISQNNDELGTAPFPPEIGRYE